MMNLATADDPHFGALKYLIDRVMGKAVSVNDLPPATACTDAEMVERLEDTAVIEETPNGTFIHIGDLRFRARVRNPKPWIAPHSAAPTPSEPERPPQPNSHANETQVSPFAPRKHMDPGRAEDTAGARSSVSEPRRSDGSCSMADEASSQGAGESRSSELDAKSLENPGTRRTPVPQASERHPIDLPERHDPDVTAETRVERTEPACAEPPGEAPIVFVTRTTEVADTLNARELDAVARPPGGEWNAESLAPLRRRDVVILGDGTPGWERHEPGWAYEDHKAITRAGIRVAILVPREISVDLQRVDIHEILRRRDVALREGAASLLPEARKVFDKEHAGRGRPPTTLTPSREVLGLRIADRDDAFCAALK
jgi:hypothetical protein